MPLSEPKRYNKDRLYGKWRYEVLKSISLTILRSENTDKNWNALVVIPINSYLQYIFTKFRKNNGYSIEPTDQLIKNSFAKKRSIHSEQVVNLLVQIPQW